MIAKQSSGSPRKDLTINLSVNRFSVLEHNTTHTLFFLSQEITTTFTVTVVRNFYFTSCANGKWHPHKDPSEIAPLQYSFIFLYKTPAPVIKLYIFIYIKSHFFLKFCFHGKTNIVCTISEFSSAI